MADELPPQGRQPTFPHEVLASIYRQRGQAFTTLHYYQMAIQDLNKAITLDPPDP